MSCGSSINHDNGYFIQFNANKDKYLDNTNHKKPMMTPKSMKTWKKGERGKQDFQFSLLDVTGILSYETK